MLFEVINQFNQLFLIGRYALEASSRHSEENSVISVLCEQWKALNNSTTVLSVVPFIHSLMLLSPQSNPSARLTLGAREGDFWKEMLAFMCETARSIFYVGLRSWPKILRINCDNRCAVPETWGRLISPCLKNWMQGNFEYPSKGFLCQAHAHC